jgi:hypothetical protein
VQRGVLDDAGAAVSEAGSVRLEEREMISSRAFKEADECAWGAE